jgi:hypothetical protein
LCGVVVTAEFEKRRLLSLRRRARHTLHHMDAARPRAL